MPDVTASRTLVKSPPELWTECSDAGSLSRHLGVFGEIRITRLEPETAVAWEGEHASGTVRLEPSGWGTKVVLTATPVEGVLGAEPAPPEPEAQPEPDPEPEPAAVEESAPAADPEPEPAPVEVRNGMFARLLSRFRREAPEPADALQPAGLPEPPTAPEPAEAPEPAVPGEAPEAEATPEAPATPPEPELKPDEPVVATATDPEAALAAALDSLGQAHHRPFSRA